MEDHITRMVYGWYARVQQQSEIRVEAALHDLVTSVHRMVREAEIDTRTRCEEIAVDVAGAEIGGRIALAIRTADPESLPRKSLIEIHAPAL